MFSSFYVHQAHSRRRIPSIPPELIVLVLEACDQLTTLRECSLVCRGWRDTAQKLLFASTTVLLAEESPSFLSLLPSFLLRRRRTPQDLILLLSIPTTANLSHLITNIHVRSDGECAMTRPLLPLLVNLKSLGLTFRKRKLLNSTPFFEDQCQIEDLFLRNIALTDFDTELQRLPNLRRLTLDNVTFLLWAQDVVFDVNPEGGVRPSRPELSSLRIRTSQDKFDTFVQQMLPHLTNLESLDVNYHDIASDANLFNLIEINKTTLRNLGIHHHAAIPSVTRATFPVLDTITLASTPRIDLFLALVQRVLGGAQPMQLSEVKLILNGSYLLCDMGAHTNTWMAVERVLLACAAQVRVVIARSLEDSFDEVAGELHPSFVTIHDLEVHPAFERLRAARRISFSVDVTKNGTS